jgi:hypothetical protein
MASYGHILQCSPHLNFTTAKAEGAVIHQNAVTQDYHEEGPQRNLFNALGYTHWDSERKLFRKEIEAAKEAAIEPLDGAKTWAEYKKDKQTELVVHTFKSILVKNSRFTFPQDNADNTVGIETPS